MTANPMVTIIVTNFKKEKFLKKAVSSCFRQSYKNIEVIVVDDCSSKGRVAKILTGFRGKNIRIFYTNKNYGHYACCNFAIDASRGEYVTFLGADDEIHRSHISNAILFIKKHKLKAACCTYGRFDQEGNRVGRGGRLCEASLTFHKRSFVKDVGYFHMVRFGADTEYRMRAIKVYGNKKIGIIHKDTYKALYLPNSLTTNSKTKGGSKSRSKYVKYFFKNIKNNVPKNLRFDYRKDKMPDHLDEKILVKNFKVGSFREILLK